MMRRAICWAAFALLLTTVGAIADITGGNGPGLPGVPAATSVFPPPSNTTNGLPIAQQMALPALNVANFNASGSAQTTTGSISSATSTNTLTLAAALDFKNGQGITVAGAGAAGAALVTTITSGAGSTVLTLAAAASTTVSGAAVSHDDTVAIQTAINEAFTLGSYEVDVPPGIYKFAGPANGTTNGIINLPTVATNGAMVTFRLKGMVNVGNYPEFSTNAFNNGVIFECLTPPSGANSNCFSGTSSAINTWSLVNLYLENITFRVPFVASNAGYDVTLWLNNVVNVDLNNVTVDTTAGTNNVTIVIPTNSQGIVLPTTGNYAYVRLHNVYVAGYFIAITVYEHAVFDSIFIQFCQNGIRPLGSNASSWWHSVIFQEVTYPIWFQNGSHWVFGDFHVEWETGAFWWTTATVIRGTVGFGKLSYDSVLVGTGQVDMAATLANQSLGLKLEYVGQSGWPPVAITVTASPFAYTATQAGTVAVSGGTVSAISITRNSTVVPVAASTDHAVPVKTGDIVTVTYSGAPTMNYLP